jgi:hypothetical protein
MGSCFGLKNMNVIKITQLKIDNENMIINDNQEDKKDTKLNLIINNKLNSLENNEKKKNIVDITNNNILFNNNIIGNSK